MVKLLTPGQGTSIDVDLPNHSLHIDNLNTDNIHLKSLICDPNSSCFVLGGSSSAVVDALRLHGILYEGLNGEARRAALVHHLLYGHCHRRSSSNCRAVAQMSTTMASLAVSLSEQVLVLFHHSELSLHVFEDLCLLLGFRKDQTRSDLKLLEFYEHRLEMLRNPHEFYKLSNFISNYDNMDRSTLMSLCGAHGLSSSGTAQLSLLFLPIGLGVMRNIFDALVKEGVIGDEREPDVIRLAPTPLYNTLKDCEHAAESLERAFSTL